MFSCHSKVCVLALTEMHSREASQEGGHTEAAEAQHLQQLDSLERVFSEAAKADEQTKVKYGPFFCYYCLLEMSYKMCDMIFC